MLSIGGTMHGGEPIVMTDQGAEPARRQPPSGGLGSIFGQGGALASRAAPFLGEWLEFEMLFPNGRRETISRPLIDRGGEAWRQSGSFDAAALRPLARDAEGLLAPRHVHNIWLSAGRHDLADYSDAGRRPCGLGQGARRAMIPPRICRLRMRSGRLRCTTSRSSCCPIMPSCRP